MLRRHSLPHGGASGAHGGGDEQAKGAAAASPSSESDDMFASDREESPPPKGGAEGGGGEGGGEPGAEGVAKQRRGAAGALADSYDDQEGYYNFQVRAWRGLAPHGAARVTLAAAHERHGCPRACGVAGR